MECWNERVNKTCCDRLEVSSDRNVTGDPWHKIGYLMCQISQLICLEFFLYFEANATQLHLYLVQFLTADGSF